MIFHGPKRTTCDNCKLFYFYMEHGSPCPYLPCMGYMWIPDRKRKKKENHAPLAQLDRASKE